MVIMISEGRAVDLATIDRVIKQEPIYSSGSPRYCLLVFGPRAEGRAWLVRDGDVLYVDRNGNGDITEEGEKLAPFVPAEGRAAKELKDWVLFRTGPLAPNPGPVSRRYPDLLVAFSSEHALMVLEHPQWPQVVGYAEPLMFSTGSRDAPILHFDGPLTLALEQSLDPSAKPVTLVRGQDAVLSIVVVTPGRGRGTYAIRPHRRLTIDSFLRAANDEQMGGPASAELKVLVELRDPRAGTGNPYSSFVLQGRC
jgi:hypothetical protein